MKTTSAERSSVHAARARKGPSASSVGTLSVTSGSPAGNRLNSAISKPASASMFFAYVTRYKICSG